MKELTYKQCKELEKAGFKQMGCDCSWISNPEDEDDIVYSPSLEELMIGCKEKVIRFSLEEHSNDWRAGDLATKEFNIGSFPKEAVFNLYINLNKK